MFESLMSVKKKGPSEYCKNGCQAKKALENRECTSKQTKKKKRNTATRKKATRSERPSSPMLYLLTAGARDYS